MELEGLQISSDSGCGQPSAGHRDPFMPWTWGMPGVKGRRLGRVQARGAVGHLPKLPTMLALTMKPSLCK